MSEGEDQNSKDRELPWTVLRLLEWTTNFFRSKGSDSPRLDAEILLAHARSCSRVELYTAYASEPSEEEKVAFREMVRRRGSGMPVAQIVGYREFYSLSFRVSEATLIPRPETEHLVVEALDCMKQLPESESDYACVDIGTGSGAIAVTLAKHLSNTRWTATDISVPALEIATWNAEQHEVADQITFLQSDLLEAVAQPERFAIICSNPPYVSEKEYSNLDATVRDFEPKTALVSGLEGTEIIDRIIQLCKDRLTAGGYCIIELSPMIADTCVDLAQSSKLFDEVRLVKDLSGHDRLLVTRRAL